MSIPRVAVSLVLCAFLMATHATHAAEAQARAYRGEEPRQKAGSGDGVSVYGRPALPAQADRVIEIRAGRRFINVTNGETILFKANGRSFAWKFSLSLDHRDFPLEQIAPRDVDVRGVRVYCIPDLYERAG